MKKPVDIINRTQEWATLTRMQTRKGPQLAFVVGRRRVGKSFVLARFAAAAKGLYFQATRRTDTEQLAALSKAVGRHFGDEALIAGATLPSWDALLAYLTRRITTTPFVLVLDEFPYLADAVPALTSLIQRYWDHEWQDTRIRLVLAGSLITAMRRIEEVDQPLYGRRTTRIEFGPFDAIDAGQFVPQWSVRDKMLLYGTVGQLPGHLALVEPEESLADNLRALALEPGGRLVDEAQHSLDAFVPNASVHYSLLAAIATGDRTWSAITSRTGHSGGSLMRPVHWLEEMGVVERVVPITEKRPAKSKRAQYRIADPYLRFWYALIAPLAQAGSIGLADSADLWVAKIQPRLDDLMGEAFEQICRDWVIREQHPFAPVRIGGWWDAKAQNEVDLVAVSSDDELLIGECKWGKVTVDHMLALRQRARFVEREYGAVTKTHLVLFTANGQADEGVVAAAAAGDLLLITADQMLG